jgi:uncharacterized protein YneF (UPF0154 family)
MSNTETAVTAMLDTEGVHPGDDRWFEAFNKFLQFAKVQSFEESIVKTLDFLGVTDIAARVNAQNNFWNVYDSGQNGSPSKVKVFFGNVLKGIKKKRDAKRLEAGHEPDGSTLLRTLVFALVGGFVGLIVGVILGLIFASVDTNHRDWTTFAPIVPFFMFMLIVLPIFAGVFCGAYIAVKPSKNKDHEHATHSEKVSSSS